MIADRLDRDIEVGAKARPRYSTDITTMDGGWEFRNSRWAYPLFEFEFTVEPGNQVDLADFVDLFHAAGGAFESFLFEHWQDNQGLAQALGTGDGATVDFQLYRVYTRGATTRRRKITRPKAGSVVGYKNGMIAPTSVNITTGILTFATAPLNGVAVTADFNFYLPVRFQDDELEFTALNRDLDQPVNVVLVEIRE